MHSLLREMAMNWRLTIGDAVNRASAQQRECAALLILTTTCYVRLWRKWWQANAFTRRAFQVELLQRVAGYGHYGSEYAILQAMAERQARVQPSGSGELAVTVREDRW